MNRMLKLKVCGMRDPKNILDVSELAPDFMGFNFYDKSKRYVGENFVVPEKFPATVKRVGVFVNESLNNVSRLVATHRLDYVQLHGDESVDTCKALQQITKVIKVFRLDENFDFDQTKPFDSISDFFLFDKKSDEYGGAGKTFDWKLLERYDQALPFFLAGGLTLDNISEVKNLSKMNLYGVDVNSGAEASPGVKDVTILNTISYILNSFPHEIHS